MRYILDDSGYIHSVSCSHIECNNKGCTEYTGTVPSGYSSLQEWATTANIRAYKIVNGDLTYDSARDAELKAAWAKTGRIENYSTSEQVIGTWFDGKPLYRKTFQVTSPSQTSSSTIIVSLDSNCVIHNYDGYLETNAKARYKLNCWFSSSDYMYSYIDYIQCAVKMRVSLDAYANRPLVITLEYTKTTD